MPAMQNKELCTEMRRVERERENLGVQGIQATAEPLDKFVKQSPGLVQLDDNINLQIGRVMVTAL